ncbi:MAG: PAS domain-containing protein [Verrucomicrobiota bacterium]
MNKPDAVKSAADLRRRAEAGWLVKRQGKPLTTGATPSVEDAAGLIHELEVHQIQLEMQNEELYLVQEELETTRAKYFDLYDLAPVGYLTLDEPGLIQEANLTAATLLGVDRGALLKQPFSASSSPRIRPRTSASRNNSGKLVRPISATCACCTPMAPPSGR